MTIYPPTQIYLTNIEKRATCKTKTEYYLTFLMPEIMNLVGSKGKKVAKDKNGENVPHLEITEAIL